MNLMELDKPVEGRAEKIVSLVLISFLALFLELTFIRWLPAHVLSLAYFSNIVLIASFFGLGFGCLIASKERDIFGLFPIALLGTVALIISLRWFEVILPVQNSEWIWSYYSGNNIAPMHFKLGIFSTLSLVYVLTASLFTLIGQKVGSLLTQFHPTTSYSLDIVGSISGIIVFSLLSFAGGVYNSPIFWFSVVSAISLWLLRKNKLSLYIGIACMLGVITLIHASSRGIIWSPYYNIQIQNQENASFSVFVNKFFHQKAVNLETETASAEKYGLPYSLIKNPRNVLILGAGTGNDVSVAVSHGVQEIDAVEIDPVIARLGKRSHPNRPYEYPGVTTHIDDARSFLKKNDKKYDMIVFGTLDSHALLSAMSTVRLDNFVYTTESLESVKQHLTEKGIAVLMFSVAQPWLGNKLIGMVSNVFTDPRPLLYAGDSNLFNLMVISGPGVRGAEKIIAEQKLPFVPIPDAATFENLPTDDWPYLYLLNHRIPSYYLLAIALLLALSVTAFSILSPWKVLNRTGLNFFSLGAAFLLLETKSITTLSLLFGSTWLVNAFVFGSILCMILVANLLISRIPAKRVSLLYACLAVSLVMNYLLPTDYFLGQSFWIKSLLPSLTIALPIFFASLLFSYHFRSLAPVVASPSSEVTEVSALYGINLIGAVLGGFLEYSSMAIGLNNLYILAAFFYLVSFLSFKRPN